MVPLQLACPYPSSMHLNLSYIPDVVDLAQSEHSDYTTTPTLSDSSNIPINLQQYNERDSEFMNYTTVFTQNPFKPERISPFPLQQSNSSNGPTSNVKHSGYLLLSLAQKLYHDFKNTQNEYFLHKIPCNSLFPFAKYLLKKFNNNSIPNFQGVCLDEGSTQSIKVLQQWLAYLYTYNLPDHLNNTKPFHAEIKFGGNGSYKVQVTKNGMITITFKLPAGSFFIINFISP